MDVANGVILIVDDTPANLSVLMHMLEASGFKLLVATSGAAALEQAEYAPPDLILLDVIMPDMNGFETCLQLKAQAATCDIPVIFMTVLMETSDKLRGFEVGAVDYITKPFQQEEVIARVNAHVTLYRQKREIERQNAEITRQMSEIERLRDEDQRYYETLSRLKDELLQTASHDLKNPLTTILVTADWLHRAALLEAEPIRQKVELIQHEARCMGEMIGSLLDLARLEAGYRVDKRPHSLRQLLERNLATAELITEQKGIQLQAELPDDPLLFPCDALQVNQVMQNLLSNAIKYTQPGGVIHVKTAVHPTGYLIEVSDTGLGIPAAAIPHLFEKFYRVDSEPHRQVSGTGLGLAIVQTIVEQHGGRISVRSEVGSGSTFSVFLPD